MRQTTENEECPIVTHPCLSIRRHCQRFSRQQAQNWTDEREERRKEASPRPTFSPISGQSETGSMRRQLAMGKSGIGQNKEVEGNGKGKELSSQNEESIYSLITIYRRSIKRRCKVKRQILNFLSSQ
uniref:Uncharacterized protein n=1 Tax=Pristionchus pacificus TaxID=54126 RepID=A0A2A6CXT4_PRIPA|eukprot:PDM82833.1 hypothetical protein PRIPAC_37226 [Pristionchus pacificus]